jgi:magnesium transporter
MPDNQKSPEIIHRIEPDTSVETAVLFDQLVLLLDSGTDEQLAQHLDGFHHSDLADAFGLLDRPLRKRLIDVVKTELDPDLLFELEDHLRKELTDSLTAREVAEVITEMDSDEAVQVLEDMDAGDRAEVLRKVLVEECRPMW